jgi:hypothetical protein
MSQTTLSLAELSRRLEWILADYASEVDQEQIQPFSEYLNKKIFKRTGEISASEKEVNAIKRAVNAL